MEVPMSYFMKKVLADSELKKNFYQKIVDDLNSGENYFSKKDLENKLD